MEHKVDRSPHRSELEVQSLRCYVTRVARSTRCRDSAILLLLRTSENGLSSQISAGSQAFPSVSIAAWSQFKSTASLVMESTSTLRPCGS